MTYLPSRPEIAFEKHKEDGRVQAILKALGKMRGHVIEWSLDDRNRYAIVFEDGSEMRGDVMWVWQHEEWIASSTLVPRKMVWAEREQKPGEWYMSAFDDADQAIHTLAQQIARITERMPEEKRVDFFEQLLRQYPGSNRAIIEMALSLTGQMPERPAVEE